MMRDLTDAEIADLRDFLSRTRIPAANGDPLPLGWVETYALKFLNAMPRLLDEVERRRADGQWTTVGRLRNGAVFETRKGIRAVKSEYHYPNGNSQCVLLASGEYGHFENGDDEPARDISAVMAEEA